MLQAMMLAMSEMGAWLLARPLASVAVLGPVDGDAVRAALEAAAPPEDGRQGLVFGEVPPVPADALAEAAAAALAQAARLVFPHWYGDAAALAGNGTAELDAVLVEARLAELRRRWPGLSTVWARAAIARLRAGRGPRVAGTPLAVELRQLALALAPGGLTLVLGFQVPPGGAEARVTAHGLEWLARASGAAVVALLSVPPPAGLGALPCVTVEEPAPPAPLPDMDPPALWFGPVLGRPHWNSPAEQALASALERDPELAGRFCFNQPVATPRGSRPRVDLLCQDARLVIEIDGYADHTTRDAFRRDRHRDYELLLSGYAVLRLTAEEVQQDPMLALDKIREATRFRCANHSEGRS
jgi:very-short-patch-repair endonuclease